MDCISEKKRYIIASFAGRINRIILMKKKPSEAICIIIPCHNEAQCIESVLQNLRRHMPDAHYVFVNDASTDQTEQIIRRNADEKVTLLNLPVNLGIGGAVQTGLIYAWRNGFDYAVKFDGDGQHLAEEINAILEPIRNGKADLVIGSRFLTNNSGFKSTFMRRLGIWIFRILSSLLTGRTITDNTSGFRAYGKRALEFAAKYYPAFDYPEPEEVILFLHNHYRVEEIPVAMAERKGGSSSINHIKAVYYMVKVVFSVFMAALRPRIESR